MSNVSSGSSQGNYIVTSHSWAEAAPELPGGGDGEILHLWLKENDLSQVMVG